MRRLAHILSFAGIDDLADWYRLDGVDQDGDWDLTLRFEIQAVGLACDDSAATITGMTFEGMQIVGTDSINTVGCR